MLHPSSTTVISMYLCTQNVPTFSYQRSASATILILFSFFFYISSNSFYLIFHFIVFWALKLESSLAPSILISSFCFLYFRMLWMLFTVNKLKYIACHGSQKSQITTSKTTHVNYFLWFQRKIALMVKHVLVKIYKTYAQNCVILLFL